VASKFVCRCGEIVRTNLYEGHGLQLLVPEEATEVSAAELQESAEGFINNLVRNAIVVAKCAKCGTLALVDNEYKIKLYAPVN
jgi:hypothetical protein